MKLKTMIGVLQHPFGSADKREQGMTILEIMIVIALMATIMTVLVTKLLDKNDEAKRDLAKVAMGSLKNGLDMYRLRNFRYPSTDEGLQALVEAPATAKNWGGPYVEASQIIDAWSQPYAYESSGSKSFKITTGGPDQQIGTEDDVVYPPNAAGADKSTEAQ